MLFTGREICIGKNCARGLEDGPRPQAEGRTQDRGQSFPYTDRPRPVNNVFIFFCFFLEVERGELVWELFVNGPSTCAGSHDQSYLAYEKEPLANRRDER